MHIYTIQPLFSSIPYVLDQLNKWKQETDAEELIMNNQNN